MIFYGASGTGHHVEVKLATLSSCDITQQNYDLSLSGVAALLISFHVDNMCCSFICIIEASCNLICV